MQQVSHVPRDGHHTNMFHVTVTLIYCDAVCTSSQNNHCHCVCTCCVLCSWNSLELSATTHQEFGLISEIQISPQSSSNFPNILIMIMSIVIVSSPPPPPQVDQCLVRCSTSFQINFLLSTQLPQHSGDSNWTQQLLLLAVVIVLMFAPLARQVQRC